MDDLFAYLKDNPEVSNAVATIASSFIALGALVVSIASIVVAVRTLRHQRNHDVLSVRPLPMVSTTDYEECLSIALRNNGVGPMMIKDLHVECLKDTRPFLREFMPELPEGLIWSTYAGKIEHYSLGASEEVVLLELKGKEGDHVFVTFRDECRRLLGNITVVVRYTDIYQTELPLFWQPLSWYSRARNTASNTQPNPRQI